MQRLHAGGHALRDEPADQRRRQRLDVFDAVRHPGGGQPVQRVEHVAHAPVADRVGGDRHAATGQVPHRRGVVAGVGPERVPRLAVHVGPLQPGGAAVDRAVDVELDPVDAPPAPAVALARREVLQPGPVRAGLAGGVEAQPDRQLGRPLERGDQLRGVAVAVHHVRGGDPGRGHPGEDLAQPGQAPARRPGRRCAPGPSPRTRAGARWARPRRRRRCWRRRRTRAVR